ncbi:N-acetylmuramoyl-L-alanine amidase [Desulfofalx alkaliphila]|uniref:N-acetylmuramoyl-L-alanine amidase n=1 Tax=Desulfofalx alkaliphila TaxID=105483 RepID=UPI00068ADE20|nr:N-acetylmuramoyl-L-alanine amidase [Desulfofalx alkaliphila]
MYKKLLTKLFKSSIIAALGALCVLGPADISPVQLTNAVALANTGQTAVITGTSVNLRSGPGTGHSTLGQVTQGDRLPVLGKEGDWLQVQSKGQSAWIAGWLVRLEGTATPANGTGATGQVAVVTDALVNLRSGPGTSHDIAGQVAQGDRLPVLGKEGHWLQVQDSKGQPAWIAGWLVRVEGRSQPEQAPAQQAPSSGKYVVLTGDGVNVRSGPGTGHSIVETVNRGERLNRLAEEGQWYKVQLPNGKEGWVANWLAKIDDAAPPANGPSGPMGESLDLAWLPIPEDDKGPGKEEGRKDDGQAKDGGGAGLKDIGIENKGDTTTVSLQADAKFDYNAFLLTNPSRLVINLEGVALGDVPESKNIQSSTVSGYRTGQFSTEPMVTRVVLELKGPTHYRTRLSDDGKTLFVDAYLAAQGDYVQDKVIFIDPGHGGNDPGAPAYSRALWESEIVLDISQRLAALLKEQGARVEMSRNSDVTVDLHERPRMANRANADIFVSVHTNANLNSAVRGTSTYYYAPDNVPELREQLNDRLRLARSIQTEMVHGLKLDDKGVIQANFAVLRGSHMPSVLVETAFISNPEEERLLRDSNFRQEVAEAIARGINAYFQGK